MRFFSLSFSIHKIKEACAFVPEFNGIGLGFSDSIISRLLVARCCLKAQCGSADLALSRDGIVQSSKVAVIRAHEQTIVVWLIACVRERCSSFWTALIATLNTAKTIIILYIYKYVWLNARLAPKIIAKLTNSAYFQLWSTDIMIDWSFIVSLHGHFNFYQFYQFWERLWKHSNGSSINTRCKCTTNFGTVEIVNLRDAKYLNGVVQTYALSIITIYPEIRFLNDNKRIAHRLSSSGLMLAYLEYL